MTTTSLSRPTIKWSAWRRTWWAHPELTLAGVALLAVDVVQLDARFAARQGSFRWRVLLALAGIATVVPAIVVPGGFTADGLPVGVEMLGRAWSEPLLIRLAYAYEQATKLRRAPSEVNPASWRCVPGPRYNPHSCGPFSGFAGPLTDALVAPALDLERLDAEVAGEAAGQEGANALRSDRTAGVGCLLAHARGPYSTPNPSRPWSP